jgi:hypothetical protein
MSDWTLKEEKELNVISPLIFLFILFLYIYFIVHKKSEEK